MDPDLALKARFQMLNDLAQNSQIILEINTMLPPKYWAIIKKNWRKSCLEGTNPTTYRYSTQRKINETIQT